MAYMARLFFTLLFLLGMKVLHINTALGGGAGIAALRHCEAMRAAGIDSKLLTLDSFDREGCLSYSLTQKQKENNKRKLFFLHKLTRLIVKRVAWHWATFDFDLSQIKEVQEADVVYIHWVNDFLSYKAIDYLLKTKKRVVWYMHDMWPITGGCHYSFDCRGYEKNCSHCPQMKALKFLASNQLKRKVKEWSGYENFYLSAPSHWLCDCIKKSTLFRGNKVFCCPNVINTTIFKPQDKNEVRKKFGLPLNKKLILFSAMGVKNPYKGTEYLVEALSNIHDENSEFVVLGRATNDDFPIIIRNRVHAIGFVSGQEEMANLYSSADLLIITSMADNFPNVVIEAMACGVPAVGFATGGIKDQIKHLWNGYIVEPRDVAGLVKGINWIFSNSNYQQLSVNARKYVIENCSYDMVLKNHSELLNGL